MSKAQEYIEEPEKTKKWSFLWWGLLFLLIWTIALMFILKAALKPQDSLMATIIAYVFGLVGLVVFAALTRKTVKVILTIPLVLIIIFGAGFLLHYLNAPVYNPLAPVSERVLNIVDEVDNFSNTTTWQNYMPQEITSNMDQIKQFAPLAFVVDLVITLPLFFFGLISVTWVVQLFSGDFSTKGVLSIIFKSLFALVFLVIGLIMTPMIHLVIAGVTGLGTNIGIGAFHMIDGFTVLSNFQNADQDDINSAVNSFNLASEWFEKGGNDIATFLSALGMIPYGVSDVADDLAHLFSAVFVLFKGLGPFVNGSYQLYQGFDYVSQAFNSSGSPIQTSPEKTVKAIIDDSLFNKGLEFVNDGLLQFGNSSEVLDEAITEVKQVNWSDIYYALNQIPSGAGTSIEPTFTQIEQYIGIFEQATGLINVLIAQPTFDNGTQSQYATLIHFFKGVYELVKAAEIIGDETNFVGTDAYFNCAAEHLNITYTALNTPSVTSLIYSDIPILNNTVAFIVDLTGLAADISYFGGDFVPVILGLNSTLSEFNNGYENITDYNSIISGLGSWVVETEALAQSATNLDTRLLDIQTKAENNTYGEFSSTASEFTSSFAKFNLTTNARNLNAIANSFYYLFSGMEDLKIATTEVNAGKVAFDVPDYPTATTHFSAANDSLASSIPKIWNASYYFNQTETGGMLQLSGSRDAIASIYFALVSIQGDMNYITSIAAGGSPDAGEITEVGNRFNNIVSTLADVNTDLLGIRAQ
ncbi:MAG: hypothetical protein ACTSSF_02570 [Candidatus Heimdallarchaeaceae archaeon]